MADESLLRLVGKCLHVGVLEGVELSTSKTGMAQQGTLGMFCKTRRASLRRIIQSVYDWCCVRHRHLPVQVQHQALTRRIQGHFNYFAVSGKSRSLLLVLEQTKRSWYKWLCRHDRRGCHVAILIYHEASLKSEPAWPRRVSESVGSRTI